MAFSTAINRISNPHNQSNVQITLITFNSLYTQACKYYTSMMPLQIFMSNFIAGRL